MAFVIPEDSVRGSEGEVGGGDRVTTGRPPRRLSHRGRRDRAGSSPPKGLPEKAWAVVLRESMTFDDLDPSGVYLGTQSGSVFVSPDEGGEWLEAASQLPPILSVEVAEWQ